MVRLNDLVCNEKYSFTGGPFGSNLKVSDFTKSGVRVIQLNNIEDIYFNDENKVFVSDYKASVLSTCNAFPGDIVFAKMMPAGRACILPDIYKRYLLGSDAIRCKLDKHKVDTTFFLESVNRESFRNLVGSKTAGSTRKRIGLPELKNFPLLIPEKKEQEKIGNLFRLLEEKNNLLNSKISTLKKYRKGIIHHLIKNGSLASKIRDLVRVEKKTGLASSYGKDIGPYPFFINNDEGIEKYCDEYAFDGQYLIINTGGTASIKFYDGKFSAMSDCLILRPIAHAIGLYYFLVANEKKSI